MIDILGQLKCTSTEKYLRQAHKQCYACLVGEKKSSTGVAFATCRAAIQRQPTQKRKINENDVRCQKFKLFLFNSLPWDGVIDSISSRVHFNCVGSQIRWLSPDKQCEHCVFTVVAARTARTRVDL